MAEASTTLALSVWTNLTKYRVEGFPNHFFSDSRAVGFWRTDMLTAMTEEDWTIVLRVFAASRSRRGDKGRNDRKFLEALHYFVVHNITWRALPEKFGH